MNSMIFCRLPVFLISISCKSDAPPPATSSAQKQSDNSRSEANTGEKGGNTDTKSKQASKDTNSMEANENPLAKDPNANSGPIKKGTKDWPCTILDGSDPLLSRWALCKGDHLEAAGERPKAGEENEGNGWSNPDGKPGKPWCEKYVGVGWVTPTKAQLKKVLDDIIPHFKKLGGNYLILMDVEERAQRYTSVYQIYNNEMNTFLIGFSGAIPCTKKN